MKGKMISAIFVLLLVAFAVQADNSMTVTAAKTISGTNATGPALTIKSFKVTAISISSANIIWYTNKAADSCVSYWTDGVNSTIKCSSDYPSDTYHMINIRNLTINTTYNYEIVSKTRQGTEARQTGSFSTLVQMTTTVISSTTAGTTTMGCANKYWFDNTAKACGYKQFCGMYMYFGLRTFDSKDDCSNALPKAEVTKTTVTVINMTRAVVTKTDTDMTVITPSGIEINKTNNRTRPVITEIKDTSKIVIPTGTKVNVSQPYRDTPVKPVIIKKLNATTNSTK